MFRYGVLTLVKYYKEKNTFEGIIMYSPFSKIYPI